MRTASLPWYDLAESRAALDALWARIAEHLRAAGVLDVPSVLGHDVDYAAEWSSGRLLLGQACGYDAVFGYSKRLRIVATPMFEFDGCRGPDYCSFIVVRSSSQASSLEDLRGHRCVINTPTSHSGMNILRALVAPMHVDGRFFGSVAVSGAHEASIRAVREGSADVASIDCITHGLLERYRPQELKGTRVISQTASIAAPPFVTDALTPAREVVELRRAIEATLDDPSQDAPGRRLGLHGITLLDGSAYEPVAQIAQLAKRLGYDELDVLPSALVSSGPEHPLEDG